MIGALPAAMRERMAGLPEPVRQAWKWDLTSGVLAGLYQGCIWTFVFRVARADLHATGAQIAWMTAAPAAGYLFATVWARQMEGRAKAPFIYWTWLVSRGLYMFTPLLRTREQFVMLVCFTPMLFSVSTPAYTAVMRDIYPDRHRGRLMGAVRMLVNVVMLITAQVMGRVLDSGVDYRLVFMLGGVFGAGSAAAFSRIKVPPSPAGEDRPVSVLAFIGNTLDILRRNPGYRWFTCSVFVSGFGNLVATTLYPIYQVDHFHVTNRDVANLQNIACIATIIGYFYWGELIDRRGPLFTVLIALGFNVVVPPMYALWDHTAMLYVSAATMGLCMAGVDLAYINTTLLFAEPGRAAQYQALHSSFFGIRGTIAPVFAIPMMHALGFRPSYLLSTSIIAAGIALQLISMRDFRRMSTARAREAAVRVRA